MEIRTNGSKPADLEVVERAASLLSVEFLKLAHSRLKAGGVSYFNSTYSSAAQKTGIVIFRYVVRVRNMVAVSDSPIEVDKRR